MYLQIYLYKFNLDAIERLEWNLWKYNGDVYITNYNSENNINYG